MVGMAVVGQWTLCAASPSPIVKSATCNSNSCPTTVNLRTELAAFRPQFRLFSRVSPTRRRRLCASSSADLGIFLPHLVASMVSVSPLMMLVTLVHYLGFRFILSGASWGDLHYGQTRRHPKRPCKSFSSVLFFYLFWTVKVLNFGTLQISECDLLSWLQLLYCFLWCNLGWRNHLSFWEEGI